MKEILAILEDIKRYTALGCTEKDTWEANKLTKKAIALMSNINTK